MTSLFAWAKACVMGCTLAMGAPASILAQSAPTDISKDGERLSDWLLRQPPDPPSFPTGLRWQVALEKEAQARQKQELLSRIVSARTVAPIQRSGLAAAVQALPITGRLPVGLADARWLQAHPKFDPVLQAKDRVVLPQRRLTVTMLRQDGTWCTVTHRSGSEAIEYLKGCEPQMYSAIDKAWLIQPDGSIHVFAVASWNAQVQDEPAPGALIWAPARNSGWPYAVSQELALFLATQDYETILERDRISRGMPKGQEPIDAPFPSVTSAPARNPMYTSNDWGMIGLLQTPTARFAEAGEARFHFSHVYPYQRFNILLQPFDWLEAGFRYSDIRNRLYGPADLSGSQSLKDKSIDFRVRLLEESAFVPQFALGMVDFGGTGLFSSEFLVANKRFGNFDWSLGIGWGNLGSSGTITNPFSKLSRRFDNRVRTSALGGTPNTSAFFRGPAALFGGLQYHTPWEKWVFKAEIDGNNYQNEPSSNNQTQRTPLNLGLVYRYGPSVDLSMGIERGNTVMLGITLHTSVAKLYAPKIGDPPTPRVTLEPPAQGPDWAITAADIGAMSHWRARRISVAGRTLYVEIDDLGGVHWDDRIERITAVLHRDAPASIDSFVLVLSEQGVVLTERVIDRTLWARQNTGYEAELRGQKATRPRAPLAAYQNDSGSSLSSLWKQAPERFNYEVVPSWQQNIGGPDGFILFRAGLAVPARFALSENVLVTGRLEMQPINNFDRFRYTAPSNLPRVRTYLREYMTESWVNVQNLQVTHFGQAAVNQYYSVYGGYLESMYGGFGAEWLYRPWHSSVAFGVDINHVQQRNYDQFFGFDKVGTQTGYRVWTGHATAYWDTGWKSTHVKLMAGRYLAGDTGFTLDVGRTFNNGVSVGAWATRTNVSAEQFGEGSFDKGMYLRIPFDVMTTSRSRDSADIIYNPLTRDGGARLQRALPLIDVTSPRNRRATSFFPATTERQR